MGMEAETFCAVEEACLKICLDLLKKLLLLVLLLLPGILLELLPVEVFVSLDFSCSLTCSFEIPSTFGLAKPLFFSFSFPLSLGAALVSMMLSSDGSGLVALIFITVSVFPAGSVAGSVAVGLVISKESVMLKSKSISVSISVLGGGTGAGGRLIGVVTSVVFLSCKVTSEKSIRLSSSIVPSSRSKKGEVVVP